MEKNGSGNEYLDFKFASFKECGTCEEHKRLHNDEDKIVCTRLVSKLLKILTNGI